MKKAIIQHLESVTVENLLDFSLEAFISFASFSGKNGGCFDLGVNTIGQFVVKSKTEKFVFNRPSDAIKQYIELVSEHYG
jgi:hypothetical protein